MIILAVDPGGTTGFAWAEVEEIPALAVPGTERGAPTFSVEVRAAQDEPMNFLALAHTWIATHPEIEVVVERYTITQRTIKLSRQSDALEVTGALRYLSHAYNGRDILLQNPADAMRLFTNERLKKLGWYVPGKEHGNDALRHLGYRLAQRGLVKLTAE